MTLPYSGGGLGLAGSPFAFLGVCSNSGVPTVRPFSAALAAALAFRRAAADGYASDRGTELGEANAGPLEYDVFGAERLSEEGTDRD